MFYCFYQITGDRFITPCLATTDNENTCLQS